MAWVALVPLLVALAGGSVRGRTGTLLARRAAAPPRAFALGLVTGVTGFAGLLYWIPDVLVTYGELPSAAAVAAGALLVAYLALFPAAFAVMLAQLLDRAGPSALLAAPLVWVTTEVGRMHLLSGFPWELLGSSQGEVLPVAQLASLVGVLGLSALVVLGNAAVAAVLVEAPRRWEVLTGVALLVAAVATWGAWRLERAALLTEGEPVQVAVVQPNIPQAEKWDPARRDAILARLLTLSRRATAAGARFIVWPESSVPFYLEDDPDGRARIAALARETRAYLLVGSDEIERTSPVRFYNSAFLLTPAGEIAATYRKMRLVPFGEYVPLRRVLFFVSPLVDSLADFSPGSEPVLLPVGDRQASTAICYEVIYPALVAEFVARGSQLLTTITNDAWYGWSSAPYQHFQQAILRAIEQGRYLVRAANTGISAIVDPYGRVVARSNLFEPAVLVGEVRWIDDRTVYARLGDSVAWASVAATAMLLVLARLRGDGDHPPTRRKTFPGRAARRSALDRRLG